MTERGHRGRRVPRYGHAYRELLDIRGGRGGDGQDRDPDRVLDQDRGEVEGRAFVNGLTVDRVLDAETGGVELDLKVDGLTREHGDPALAGAQDREVGGAGRS